MTATKTAHPKNASRFARGSGVYKCRCCERMTRATGRGDNEHVHLCADCFDLAGEDNHLSDNGTFYAGAQAVLELIGAVRIKDGKAEYWRDLENKARIEMGLDPIQEVKGPCEVIVTLNNPDGSEVRTAYPLSKKVDALIQVSGYMADNKSFTITYE